MQPLGAVEDGFPVIGVDARNRHGRIGPVVDHVARALVGTGLQEVEPQSPLVRAHDVGRVDPRNAGGERLALAEVPAQPQAGHGRVGAGQILHDPPGAVTTAVIDKQIPERPGRQIRGRLIQLLLQSGQ